jgi:hypothetical protein
VIENRQNRKQRTSIGDPDSMSIDARKFARWALVAVALILSTVAALLCTMLSPLSDRLLLALAATTHLSGSLSAIVKAADALAFFGIILVWIMPPALAIVFALGARWLNGWRWGFFASFLLVACFFWVRARSDRDPAVCWIVSGALALILAERLGSTRRLLRRGAANAIEATALLLLFAPVIGPLVFAQKTPPEPRMVWSVVLQKGTWQAMNTGSEFAATREVAFAGDRVAVVFDAGSAPPQGKQPMSHYRVLSLDKNTGAVRNQAEFIGHWGALPVLLGTSSSQLILGARTLQWLSPNLETAGRVFSPDHGRIDMISPDRSTLAWETSPGTTLMDANSFKPVATLSQSAPTSVSRQAVLTNNDSWPTRYPGDSAFITRTDAIGSTLIFHGACGGRPEFLTSDRILSVGCGWIRILDNDGRVVVARRDPEGAYSFAGVSQNGARFALQASDARGDPPSLLYERFYIYDVNSAAPVASIPVSDLPERQSWTAFSPDGRFIAVGNPNRLNLYELP